MIDLIALRRIVRGIGLVVIGAGIGTLIAIGLLHSTGCGGALRVQAVTADALAQAWNTTARPTMLAAYEREQYAALDAVCAPDAGTCDVARARAAVAAVRARWAPAWASLEVVRRAHDAWRLEIERCRLDAGTCGPALDGLAAAFAGALAAWRCDVRALGRVDLDRLPGPAPVCATDAGSDIAPDGAADGGHDGD